MTTKKKKKIVTVIGKNGGKIKTTVGSNTYNTLIKNGGKVSSSSSSSSSSSGSSSGSSTKSVAQQVADIAAQAQAIQNTFNEVKGTMTQSEIDKASAGISQASSGIKQITASDGVAKATGGTGSTGIDYSNPINQGYAAALAGNPISLPVSKAVAPTSPTDIKALNPVVAPTTDPTVVSPVNGIAVSDGMQTYLDAIQKQLEQQQARNDKLAKDNQTLMEKTLGTMKNPEDVYDQAWKDTGMSAKEYFATQEAGIKEIDSLNSQYATVQGAMEQQIAQTNDKMASMNFINNQTAQIRRNAEPQLNTISAKISSKAATLQALQGNFAEARSLVRDAVDAATAGNKFKYDMYLALYEQNKDNFDRVEKSYSEAYSNAMNIALKDYEMQREEKMQIGELMLKYPSAGIDMNGSLDEAFERAGMVSGTDSGKVELTADMKNYEYAQRNGYKGTFAEWLGKNGSSGAVPKEKLVLGSGEAGMETYSKLEALGMSSSDIIALQNELNAGKTLKEIAEESGMPNSLYLELQNNYITDFDE